MLWLEAGLCPDVREELGGALYVHSPQAPPIVLPSTGVKTDVFSLVSGYSSNGWERPKQAVWEFKVEVPNHGSPNMGSYPLPVS